MLWCYQCLHTCSKRKSCTIAEINSNTWNAIELITVYNRAQGGGFSIQQCIQDSRLHCDHEHVTMSLLAMYIADIFLWEMVDPRRQQTRTHSSATRGLSRSSWFVATDVASSYCTRQPANAMVRKGLRAHITPPPPHCVRSCTHTHRNRPICATLSRRVSKNSLRHFHTQEAHSALHNYALSNSLAPVLSDLQRLTMKERWAPVRHSEKEDKAEIWTWQMYAPIILSLFHTTVWQQGLHQI